MSTPPNPGSKSSMDLYTIRGSDGVEYGPSNIAQVQELVKQGRVKATTMVFTQSGKRWHLAASIPEVRSLLRQYNPSQDSALNRIRSMGGNIRNSAHAIMAAGRVSTIRIKKKNIFAKLPFWRRFFN
jgi:hypothetical protein